MSKFWCIYYTFLAFSKNCIYIWVKLFYLLVIKLVQLVINLMECQCLTGDYHIYHFLSLLFLLLGISDFFWKWLVSYILSRFIRTNSSYKDEGLTLISLKIPEHCKVGNEILFWNMKNGRDSFISDIGCMIQVIVRNVPPDPDESVSELVEHFFLVNHPEHYLTHQVKIFLRLILHRWHWFTCKVCICWY